MSDPSSDSDVESKDEDAEDAMEGSTGEAQGEGWLSDKIEAPPIKKPHLESAEGVNPPPPHVYHPLTGAPLPGLLYVSLTAPAVPAPLLPPADSSTKSKGKGKAVQQSSPASPSPHDHAACNKWSPPHSSKDCRKAKKSLTPSRNKIDSAAAPVALLEADNVDNMIYVWAFHLLIDLQFHKPPSHQALESMKLSMLLPCLTLLPSKFSFQPLVYF